MKTPNASAPVAFALVSLLSACSSEAPAPQSRTGLGANDNQTDQVLESVRLFEAFAPSNATNSSPTMSANEDRS